MSIFEQMISVAFGLWIGVTMYLLGINIILCAIAALVLFALVGRFFIEKRYPEKRGST